MRQASGLSSTGTQGMRLDHSWHRSSLQELATTAKSMSCISRKDKGETTLFLWFVCFCLLSDVVLLQKHMSESFFRPCACSKPVTWTSQSCDPTFGDASQKTYCLKILGKAAKQQRIRRKRTHLPWKGIDHGVDCYGSKKTCHQDEKCVTSIAHAPTHPSTHL